MNYVVLDFNLEEKDIISCVEELLPVECQTAANHKNQALRPFHLNYFNFMN